MFDEVRSSAGVISMKKGGGGACRFFREVVLEGLECGVERFVQGGYDAVHYHRHCHHLQFLAQDVW